MRFFEFALYREDRIRRSTTIVQQAYNYPAPHQLRDGRSLIHMYNNLGAWSI